MENDSNISSSYSKKGPKFIDSSEIQRIFCDCSNIFYFQGHLKKKMGEMELIDRQTWISLPFILFIIQRAHKKCKRDCDRFFSRFFFLEMAVENIWAIPKNASIF